MNDLTRPTYSPWTHRLALALAAVAFPVIWVGSLVTTYNSGMAVPDWPGTYGYNLFLYPWTTWILGPWDLFVEHGHRLLASLCGFIAILLTVVAFRNRSRRWIAWLALGALGLVLFQGILGGVRVLFDERLIAMIHGVVGPAFFGYCIFLCVVTRKSWQDAAWSPTADEEATSPFGVISNSALAIAVGFTALALIQIALGAGVRHLNMLATRELFVGLVVAHIAAAGLLWFYAFAIFAGAIAHRTGRAPTRRAFVTFALVTMQLLLGAGTWIVNYSLPEIESYLPWLAGYAIEQEGLLQSYVVTAHVMFGTLILAAGVTIIAFEWKPAFYPAGRVRASERGTEPLRADVAYAGGRNSDAATAGRRNLNDRAPACLEGGT